MKGSKIFNYMGIKRILMCIVWFLIYSFFCQGQQAWSSDIGPFKATLEIQQVDSECNSTPINTAKLTFGFAGPDKSDSESFIPAPPPPPQYCLDAFFDPSHTTVDGKNIYINTGFGEGWENAVMPIPNREANWGIKIIGSKPETIRVKLSWDSQELKKLMSYGLFRLKSGDTLLADMRRQSEYELSVSGGEVILNIEYSKCDSEYSVLGIICAGGTEKEGGKNKLESSFNAFCTLGDQAYINLYQKKIKNREDIRYIFYHPHDVDYDQLDDTDQNTHISQKDRLEEAITQWPVERWTTCRPQSAILLIYLVDHGEYDQDKKTGSLFIDPNPSDPNDQKLTAGELNRWLNILEGKLSNMVRKYEIITVIEACKSNTFIDTLWPPDQSSHSKCRVFITSAEEGASISLAEKNGYDAFSYYFWNYLGKGKTLRDAFVSSQNLLTDQDPQFKCDPDRDQSAFLIDKVDIAASSESSEVTIPFIKKVTSESLEQVNRFSRKAAFNVCAYDSFDKVKAVVVPPNCSDGWCRSYLDASQCYIDGNQCTFNLDYHFSLPGTYGVHVYIKKGEQLSVPYVYFLDIDIPVQDLHDEYEPDNDRNQARMYQGESQIHSLHDPNDIDWIKFPAAPAKYEIKLIPPCPLPVDPDTIPFQVVAVTDKGGEKTLSVIHHTYPDDKPFHIDGNVGVYHLYTALWENKEDVIAYLKITSTKEYREYNQFLPYYLSITIPELGKDHIIIKGSIKESRKDIFNSIFNEDIKDMYLLNNQTGKKIFPQWVQDQEDIWFLFFNVSKGGDYSLKVGETNWGPVDSNSMYLDLNSLFFLHLYPGLNRINLTAYQMFYTGSSPIKSEIHPITDGQLDSFSLLSSLPRDHYSSMRYDRHQGKWQQSYYFFGRPSGDRFNLRKNEKYLIYIDKEMPGWLPYITISGSEQ